MISGMQGCNEPAIMSRRSVGEWCQLAGCDKEVVICWSYSIP